MDFIDQVSTISQQVQKLRESVKTEQATKNAFVLSLINALGYNIFDTTEVCPEYIAATPGLKGEKVDYAIIINNEPGILIECKWCGDNLEHPKHGSQLYKYFNATSAKFAVLTNGILYQFYTDNVLTSFQEVRASLVISEMHDLASLMSLVIEIIQLACKSDSLQEQNLLIVQALDTINQINFVCDNEQSSTSTLETIDMSYENLQLNMSYFAAKEISLND